MFAGLRASQRTQTQISKSEPLHQSSPARHSLLRGDQVLIESRDFTDGNGFTAEIKDPRTAGRTSTSMAPTVDMVLSGLFWAVRYLFLAMPIGGK